MRELLAILDRGALSAVLTDQQKARKVSNLLQKMKAEGTIDLHGVKGHATWHLADTN